MSNQVQDQERIVSLDVMRGFALLGILLANSIAFQFGMLSSYQPVDGMYQIGRLDQATHFFIRLLVDGSFITLFSFLFGYGMALQKARLSLRSVSYTPIFWRRTVLLLFFGLAHLFFIWRGDILVTYSFAAMILFAFLFLSTKQIFAMAVVWFFLAASMVFIPDVGGVAAPDSFLAEQVVLAEGSYVDNVLFRFTHDLIGLSNGNGALFVIGELFYQLSAVFTVMPMFLLGAFAARKQWFSHPKVHSRLFKIGLPCALLVGLAAKFPNAYTEGVNTQLQSLAIYIGAPALALFYAGLIAVIIEKSSKNPFAPLASVGRMAFTNYLLQSICFTLLFYGYGFGFYAELGIFYGSVLSISFFVAQILVSMLWLHFFRMGPLEWVWRAGTYLSLPKLKR